MLDKHQQNLDTFKEYLKENDLSIRLSNFEPKYSLNDEKTVLRFTRRSPSLLTVAVTEGN
jgi:hypothetical protein